MDSFVEKYIENWVKFNGKIIQIDLSNELTSFAILFSSKHIQSYYKILYIYFL